MSVDTITCDHCAVTYDNPRDGLGPPVCPNCGHCHFCGELADGDWQECRQCYEDALDYEAGRVADDRVKEMREEGVRFPWP